MKTIKKPNLKDTYQIPAIIIFCGSILAIMYTATEFNAMWDEYNLLVAVLVMLIPIITLCSSVYFIFREGGKGVN